MRKTCAAVAGVLALAGAANAQVFNFGGTGPLAGFGATASQNFVVAGGGNITGFKLTADMVQAQGFAWNSDMQLKVTGPNGSFTVGPTFGNPAGAWGALGTGTPPPDGAAGGPLNMDFVFNFGAGAGNWTVSFTNGYTFNTATDVLQWNSVVVTLVPTPASAALLGLGGLVALRRRR